MPPLDSGLFIDAFRGVSVPTFDTESACAPVSESPPALEDSGVFGKTRARVLVVDDEQLIARSLSRTLAHHAVTAVNHAREALSLIDNGATFDVILCDLMMPDVDGLALYDLVAEKHPEVARRFVFMTGGVFSGNDRDRLDLLATPQLEKPFSAEAIRDCVVRVLRESGSAT